jgi:hypothetical protein
LKFKQVLSKLEAIVCAGIIKRGLRAHIFNLIVIVRKTIGDPLIFYQSQITRINHLSNGTIGGIENLYRRGVFKKKTVRLVLKTR